MSMHENVYLKDVLEDTPCVEYAVSQDMETNETVWRGLSENEWIKFDPDSTGIISL